MLIPFPQKVARLLMGCLTCLFLAQNLSAQDRMQWTDEELRMVYGEALAVNSGLEYQFDFARFEKCSDAAAALERTAPPQPGMMSKPLRQVTGTRHITFRAMAGIMPGLREQIRLLDKGEKTGVVSLADGSCVIAELRDTRPTSVPSFAAIKEFLPQMIEQGLLPSPIQLQEDPVLRRRTLANSIRSVSALSELPADFDINTRRSNGYTLLTHALLMADLAFAKAVLARGADPNLCAPWACPLDLALGWKNEQESEEIVRALLKAGANPNQADLALKANTLPLSSAALHKGIAFSELLIASGAKINPEGFTPPLFYAAHKAKRDLVDYLIAKGADPFAIDPTAGVYNRLTDAAQSSEDKDFQSWLKKKLVDLALGSGQHRWEGWIEQNGKRFPLTQAEIRLKRNPFRIIVRLKENQTLFVVSAESDVLQRELQSGSTESFIFRGAAVWGAEETDGSSELLFVNKPVIDANATGMTQAWFWESPSHRRFSGRIKTANGFEYFRTVSKFLVEESDDKTAEVPVQKYRGNSLYLILDLPLNLSLVEHRFMHPRLVRLRFD